MTTRVISEASRNATLKDVARLAGVSVSTASKALNGRKDVGEATRVRVVRAAEQLAFSPNALAQGLIAQRSGTVGLLTSDLEGRFSIPILMGAEDAFGSDMTSVFLCDARGDAIREQHHLRALLSRRVDGLIVVGARPDVRSSLGHDLGVPVVYAYAPSDDPNDLSLVTDHYGGGELAVDHLLTYGRTRIGHISGDASYGAAQARARGAIDRLERDGLELAGGQVFFGAWSEAWGRNATRELLRRAPGYRRHLRGLRPDRSRCPGHARPGRCSRARPGLGRRLRQLGSACHELPSGAHHHRHEPAAARPHRRPAAVLRNRRATEVRRRDPTVPPCRPRVLLAS